MSKYLDREHIHSILMLSQLNRYLKKQNIYLHIKDNTLLDKFFQFPSEIMLENKDFVELQQFIKVQQHYLDKDHHREIVSVLTKKILDKLMFISD